MKRFIHSFVAHRSRIKGAKLDLLQNKMLPSWGVESFNEVQQLMMRFDGISIEIGSGYGDTLVHLAEQNPKMLFVGCEVYRDAVYSTCRKIEEYNIENVRIFTKDARVLCQEIPNECVTDVYLLFPDPWPKSRHHKRRIFSDEFLAEQHRILKSGGMLFVATDSDSYKQHIAEVIFRQTKFQWNAKSCYDFTKEPDWWHKTKFQRKAETEGRNCVFIELTKV